MRETGADGTVLPVGDWPGKRFTIDTVAPSGVANLSAVLATDTGSPVAAVGWESSDPASDTASVVSYAVALDGVNVATTFDTTISVPLPDEGRHTLTVTPADLAGNIGPDATTDLTGASNDATPPITQFGSAPASNAAGWNRSDVLVSLSASDAPDGSGVARTVCQLDDQTPGIFTGAVLLSTEGTHTVRFRSIDRAGNAEATQTATIRIDEGVPTTTDDHVTSYTASATVHLLAADPLSGVASTTWTLDGSVGTGLSPATSTLGSHTLKYATTDVAGNVEDTHTVTFVVLATPPTVYSTKVKLSGASSIKVRKSYKLLGTISPSAAGGRVKIVLTRLAGRKYRSYSTVYATLVRGTFSYSFKPKYRGSWRATVSFGGQTTATAIYKAAPAATKAFKVK